MELKTLRSIAQCLADGDLMSGAVTVSTPEHERHTHLPPSLNGGERERM